MLTWVLAALFISGVAYGLASPSGHRVQAIPKSRFKPGVSVAAETVNNEKVFALLKKSSQKVKLDYSIFEKDSIARDLYWAGIRSTAAVQTIPMVINLIAAAPLMILGFLYATNPPSTRVMLGIIIGGYAAYTMAKKSIKGKALKRQNEIERDLPQFLDLLVICVEAGQNFLAAVQTLTQELDSRKPLIEESITMYQEYLSGMTMSEACARMTKRCGSENLATVLGNVVQSEKIGSSLGQTLRILASEIRDKRRAHLKEEANKMGVKSVFPCALIMIAMMVVMMGPALVQVFKLFEK